jgi:serine/threonine protein kinase
MYYLFILIICSLLRKEYGFECDMWSLAMVLFELMESTHPFEGENDAQIAINVRGGNIKPLKSERPNELVALYNSLRNMVFVCMDKIFSFFIGRILQNALSHWIYWIFLLFTIQLFLINFLYPHAYRCFIFLVFYII